MMAESKEVSSKNNQRVCCKKQNRVNSTTSSQPKLFIRINFTVN